MTFNAKNCRWCGETFSVQVPRRRAEYCSAVCYQEAARSRLRRKRQKMGQVETEKRCRWCGETFVVRGQRSQAEYCSVRCRADSRTVYQRERKRLEAAAEREVAAAPAAPLPPPEERPPANAPGRIDVWHYVPYGVPQWQPRTGMDGAEYRRGAPIYAVAEVPAVVVWYPYEGGEPQVWGIGEYVRRLNAVHPLRERGEEIARDYATPKEYEE